MLRQRCASRVERPRSLTASAVSRVMSTVSTWYCASEPSSIGLAGNPALERLRSENAPVSTTIVPPRRRSFRSTFSAAGFMATSTSTSSPGVVTSTPPKWIWKADTPYVVPAGARISAGKSGKVVRSFPARAASTVKREPVTCIPSPESPAKRMTTDSRACRARGGVEVAMCEQTRRGCGRKVEWPSRSSSNAQCGRYDPRLLGLVCRGIALRGARALRSPDVAYGHVGADELTQLRQHELLRPHVAWLLLHPHDLAQLGVPADQRRQLLARERIEQLHPGDRHVPGLGPRRSEREVVVHLAAAQYEPAHGVAGRRCCVVERRLEASGRQVLEPRARLRQPQQALRGEQHERPQLGVARLAPEQMEVLGRRRTVGDADVPVGAEREEALDAGARVLGSLALVTVGEKQREARRLPPLREPGDDELIDDHLAAVGEVAVLGLPQDQGLGCRGRVAVLEA